jgi:hypothetical protein
METQKIKFLITSSEEKHASLKISPDGDFLIDIMKNNKYDYITIALGNAKICITQNIANPDKWAIYVVNMNDCRDLIKKFYKEYKFLSPSKIKSSVEKIISTYQLRAIFG